MVTLLNEMLDAPPVPRRRTGRIRWRRVRRHLWEATKDVAAIAVTLVAAAVVAYVLLLVAAAIWMRLG